MPLDIQIEEVTPLAYWTWDSKDEECHICSNLLDTPCPECNMPGDDCGILFGRCNHVFHGHCITEWNKDK
ncbi:hypothetical protein KIPB_014682, partial [Kipferlia bialata]|eukprot:g14682.t1